MCEHPRHDLMHLDARSPADAADLGRALTRAARTHPVPGYRWDEFAPIVLAELADLRAAPAGESATVGAMRAWLADCTWRDVDAADIAAMGEQEILDAVERHWAGGAADFLRELLEQERGTQR